MDWIREAWDRYHFMVRGLAEQMSAYQEWRCKDVVVGWYLLCTNK